MNSKFSPLNSDSQEKYKTRIVDVLEFVWEWNKLKSELGSFPVSSFGIVPDLVIGLEPKPLWQRSVLLSGFRQHLLDFKALVWGHFEYESKTVKTIKVGYIVSEKKTVELNSVFYLNELCRYLKGYERIKLLIRNKEGRPIEDFLGKKNSWCTPRAGFLSEFLESHLVFSLFYSHFLFQNIFFSIFSHFFPTTYNTSPILVRPFQYSKK